MAEYDDDGDALNQRETKNADFDLSAYLIVKEGTLIT